MFTLLILWLLFDIIDDLCDRGRDYSDEIRREVKREVRREAKKLEGKMPTKCHGVMRVRERKPNGTTVDGECRWTTEDEDLFNWKFIND